MLSRFVFILLAALSAASETYYRALQPYTLHSKSSAATAKSTVQAMNVIISSNADSSEISKTDSITTNDVITNRANYTVCEACILALGTDGLVGKANTHSTDSSSYCIRVWDTDAFPTTDHCVKAETDTCVCYRGVAAMDGVGDCGSGGIDPLLLIIAVALSALGIAGVVWCIRRQVSCRVG